MTTAEYLFLDTEWANHAQRELVSLALVSRDGNRRFYEPGAPRSLLLSVRWQHRF